MKPLMPKQHVLGHANSSIWDWNGKWYTMNLVSHSIIYRLDFAIFNALPF